MWSEDKDGQEFSGPKEAFKAFRDRAKRAIAHGDANGFDVRQVCMRLSDEAGSVLFEGTTEEAASLQIDGKVYLPNQLKER